MPVAAGTPRLPAVRCPGGHGAQVRGINLIEASLTNAEFGGTSHGRERAFTEARQEVPYEGGSVACSELVGFFSWHTIHAAALPTGPPARPASAPVRLWITPPHDLPFVQFQRTL